MRGASSSRVRARLAVLALEACLERVGLLTNARSAWSARAAVKCVSRQTAVLFAYHVSLSLG